jgi:diguanylate cyclase (GGDEF)-like protein
MDKEKILLVSADSAVISTLTDGLSPVYEVYPSSGFNEAFNTYKDTIFHTVITAAEAGIEIIGKLQKTPADPPIIVITEYGSVPLALAAVIAGERDYIKAPFELEELKLVVQHAFERRKPQEEVNEGKYFGGLELVDSLTSTYNRRYFEDLLQREEWRAKRYPQKFSILMIDVDGFTKLNDYYGRPAGDKVLALLGAMIRSRIRNTDVAARYGGEKFAVITPHTDKQHALVLAGRLQGFIAREDFLVDGFKVKVTVSIGLATFNEDAYTKEELLNDSELALAQAKKLGKNRVCLFGTAGTHTT